MIETIKGVCYSPAKNRYLAYINVFKEHIRLGSYKTLDEATSIRREAEHYYDASMVQLR